MKKRFLLALAVLVLVMVDIVPVLVTAQSRTIVINPGPLYTVRVNGQLRELRTTQDKEGNLHLLFFKDQEFLGEEIFDKDDVKSTTLILKTMAIGETGISVYIDDQDGNRSRGSSPCSLRGCGPFLFHCQLKGRRLEEGE